MKIQTMNVKSQLLAAISFALFVVPASAAVKLPALFSDDMMLQRDQPIAVWGWADPGEEVTVKLGEESSKVKAGESGEWKVKLPALKSGENLELTVAGTNSITFKNIIIGDVWICSGQSNMEFSLGGANTPEDINTAEFPKIRVLKVGRNPAPEPKDDIPSPAAWRVCTPQNARGFTAVGFFFGREIHRQTGIPIGLIDVNWGGTRIETWLDPQGMGSIPELAGIKEGTEKAFETEMEAYRKQLPAQIDQLEAWIQATREALAANTALPARPNLSPDLLAQPRIYTLFNGMIHPLVSFPIKGAIWYQGESNGGEDDIYFHKMRALIGGWRAMWNIGDFPFYYVQLAGYQNPTNLPAGGDGWAKTRCAQMKALTIPNTGMASALDIGEVGDIHPKNKRDVGIRLALWALARDYGRNDIVPGGPIFQSAKVEGSKIRLSFEYVGKGLMIGKKNGLNPTEEDKSGKLSRFAIAGDDKKWVWADAVIDGDTVVVSSKDVPSPVAVRYAFSQNPVGANLYNKEGLPASPFRTDDW